MKKGFIKNITAFMALLLITGIISAQQEQGIAGELKKINTSLKKYASVKMDVSYVYYTGYSSKKPIDTQNGQIRKKGDMQYSRLMGTESIVNERYQLIVDSSEKRIIIGKKSKNAVPTTLSDMDFEKLLKMYDSPATVSDGKRTGYKFLCKKGIKTDYNAIDIYYNKQTYVIEKLVLYYGVEVPVDSKKENGPKDKPRLEIVFSNINLDAKLTDADFSEKKFVKENKNEFQPLPKYSNYSIIKNGQ